MTMHSRCLIWDYRLLQCVDAHCHQCHQSIQIHTWISEAGHSQVLEQWTIENILVHEDMKCWYLLHKHRLKKQSPQLHYAECSWVPTASIRPLSGCNSHTFGGTPYHWIHHKCKSEDRKRKMASFSGDWTTVMQFCLQYLELYTC